MSDWWFPVDGLPPDEEDDDGDDDYMVKAGFDRPGLNSVLDRG